MKKGMLRTILGIFVVAVILVIVAFGSGALFIIDESKQVVITQFGKPVGNQIVSAGLHFKKPFILLSIKIINFAMLLNRK